MTVGSSFSRCTAVAPIASQNVADASAGYNPLLCCSLLHSCSSVVCASTRNCGNARRSSTNSRRLQYSRRTWMSLMHRVKFSSSLSMSTLPQRRRSTLTGDLNRRVQRSHRLITGTLLSHWQKREYTVKLLIEARS